MSNFFAMGGYALFVWTAYGLSAVILGLNVVAAIRREHRLQHQFIAASMLPRPGST